MFLRDVDNDDDNAEYDGQEFIHSFIDCVRHCYLAIKERNKVPVLIEFVI